MLEIFRLRELVTYKFDDDEPPRTTASAEPKSPRTVKFQIHFHHLDEYRPGHSFKKYVQDEKAISSAGIELNHNTVYSHGRHQPYVRFSRLVDYVGFEIEAGAEAVP